MSADQSKYGGISSYFNLGNDDPWTRLSTIREHLENGKPIPPALARWLGEAIEKADQVKDNKVFARELGLIGKQGRKKKSDHADDAWLVYGTRVEMHLARQRVAGLNFRKMEQFTADMLNSASKPKAVNHVINLYERCNGREVSYDTVWRWHEVYLKAKNG